MFGHFGGSSIKTRSCCPSSSFSVTKCCVSCFECCFCRRIIGRNSRRSQSAEKFILQFCCADRSWSWFLSSQAGAPSQALQGRPTYVAPSLVSTFSAPIPSLVPLLHQALFPLILGRSMQIHWRWFLFPFCINLSQPALVTCRSRSLLKNLWS